MFGERKNIYLILVINFLHSLVFYAGISTIYRQESGLELSEIFIIESISWIITFLLEFPFGRFSDRYGYKVTIIVGNLFYFISKIIFYNADTYSIFLLERVFLAIAIAALSGSDIGLLFESSSEKSAKYFGYLKSISTLGLVLASFTAPLLIRVNIRLSALATIFPYGIALILSLFLEEKRTPVEKRSGKSLNYFRRLLKKPQIVVFLLLTAIITEISFAVGNVLSQPQYINGGLSVRYLTLVFAVMQFIPMVSAFTSRCIKAFGKRRIILTAISLIGVGTLLLALTSNLTISIISTGIVSLSASIFIPISYDIQNLSLSSESRTTYLSIYAMIMELVSVLFNILIGKLADISLSHSYGFMFILLGFTSIAFLLILNTKNSSFKTYFKTKTSS